MTIIDLDEETTIEEPIGPGRYWLIVVGGRPPSIWPRYQKTLVAKYGAGSIKTIQTKENVDIDETWLIVDIKTPMHFDPAIIKKAGKYEAGDDAVNTGQWDQEDADWIHTANEAVENVTGGVNNIVGGVEKVAVAAVVIGLVFWLAGRSSK